MAPDVLIVLQAEPLVLAAVVGSPDDIGHLTSQLTAEHATTAFVGVMAADDEAHLELMLVGLAAPVAEIIFTASTTASSSLPGLDAGRAALLALERHGVGQDFVFQVDELGAAVRYAVEAVTSERSRWDGTAVLVVGGTGVIDAARAALDAPEG